MSWRPISCVLSSIALVVGTAIGFASSYAAAIATSGALRTAATPAPVHPPTRSIAGVHLLRAEAVSADRVQLSWVNPPNETFNGTVIRRALGPIAPSEPDDGTSVTRAGRKDVAYLDEHLMPGQSYSYAVFATDRTGHHAPAATATVQLPAAVRPGATTPQSTPNTDTGISGRITDRSTQAPVADAVVATYDGNSTLIAFTRSLDNGTYRIDLPPGAYYVCVDATHVTAPSPTGYIGGCYRALPWWNLIDIPIGAAPVSVTQDAVHSGANLALAAGGGIAGTVTDAQSGAAVGGVTVTMYASRTGYSQTETSADGTYGFEGVAPTRAGNIVCFASGHDTTGPSSTGYLPQCYDGADYFSDSTPVPVTAGVVSTGIDGALDRSGAIAGTVTSTTGEPVAKIEVRAYRFEWRRYTPIVTTALTDSEGRYRLTGLPENTTGYYVCFDTARAIGFPIGYQRQCYQDQPWVTNPPFGHTISVPVTLGATTTGIDAHLQPAGAISGTVTDIRDGTGVGDVEVLVIGARLNVISTTKTSPSGGYRLPGLSPTSSGYFLCFWAAEASGGDSAGGYRSECYRQQQWDPEEWWPLSHATRVQVQDGAVRTGVNARLLPGGAITGRVTAHHDQPLAHAEVFVFTATGDVAWASTEPDGSYAAAGLAPSTAYKVCVGSAYVVGGSSPGGYLDECYKHVRWSGQLPLPGEARAVPVTAGAVTSGIDISLPPGGGIAGAVTSSRTATAVAGIEVSVYDPAGTYAGGAETTATGRYVVRGLPPDAVGYRVCFNGRAYPPDLGYQYECYANSVPTRTGSLTAGIDAQLVESGAIAGTVAGVDGGTPYGNVVVRTTSGDSVGGPIALGAGGTYFANNLPPSEAGYVVCVDTHNYNEARPADPGRFSSSSYVSQCYRNVDWDLGTPIRHGLTLVRVRSGLIRSNTDFRLDPAGEVAGHITKASDGSDLGSAQVLVFDSSGLITNVNTDDTGLFWIDNLRPSAGPLAVCFRDVYSHAPPTGYAPECYPDIPWDGANTSVPSAAYNVSVQPGTTTENVDAALDVAGAISGQLTDATTGNPLVNPTVIVHVFDSSGAEIGWGTPMATDGSYRVTSLTPATGPYSVCFSAVTRAGTNQFPGNASQCYQGVVWDGGRLPSGTTTVSVAAGEITGGIDAALDPGGGLVGHVTADSIAVGGIRVDVFAGRALVEEADLPSSLHGHFYVYGLTPGTYKVCADVPNDPDIQPRCWKSADWSGGYVRNPPPPEARQIRVSAGAVAKQINIHLPSRG